MMINNRYRIENRKLGSGSFSDVYLGTDTEKNKPVAIKQISLNKKEEVLKKIISEIEIMRRLDHPNVVKFYEFVETKEYWYIIMEYCNAGTISDVIKYNEKMSKTINFNREANSYYYLEQLKNAIDYIQKNNLTHRDIKPMNILLHDGSAKPEFEFLDANFEPAESELFDVCGELTKSDPEIFGGLSNSLTKFKSKFPDERCRSSGISISINADDKKIQNNDDYEYSRKLIVKLADFGLAKSQWDIGNQMVNTICGSPMYMAPEILIDMIYDSRVDLWSYGVIMYELLFGIHPTTGTSISNLKNNLKNKEIKFYPNKNFSTECFDLLKKLLTKDKNRRISWENFFNHKWFHSWNDRIAESHTFVNKKIVPFSLPVEENEQPLRASKSSIYLSASPTKIQSNLSKMTTGSYALLKNKKGTYTDFPGSYLPAEYEKSFTGFNSSSCTLKELEKPAFKKFSINRQEVNTGSYFHVNRTFGLNKDDAHDKRSIGNLQDLSSSASSITGSDISLENSDMQEKSSNITRIQKTEPIQIRKWATKH